MRQLGAGRRIVLIARGIVVAVLVLAIPVLAAAPAAGTAPADRHVTCSGPVPPGGEINRCNALRAMAELRGG